MMTTTRRPVALVAAAFGLALLGLIMRGLDRTSDPASEAPSAALAPAPGPGSGVSSSVLAARTVDRLMLLRTGHGPPAVTLGSEDVTALVTERLPGLIPDGIEEISVVIRDGAVHVQATVLTGVWSGAERLGPAVPVLPSRVRAELDGRLHRAGRRVVFTADGARAHGVPLPMAVVQALLGELPLGGRGEHPGTLEIGLPDGIADVRVVGDRLILDAVEPILERTVDDGDDA